MSASLDTIGLQFGTDKTSAGHDYLRHYERYFERFRHERFRLLEIGGLHGASLRMWSEYFPKAEIVCIDIDKKVEQHATDRIKIEIGDASSKPFLEQVLARYPRPTVVVDDGSHRWDHQKIAFETLFPALNPGGIYIIEAMHSSYEPNFAGFESQPFSEYLISRMHYLHLRGERRKEYEKLYAPWTVEATRQIESMTYVPRACIITKKGTFDPGKSFPMAYKTEFPIILERDYAQRGDVSIEKNEAHYEITVPPCFGSLTRESSVREIKVPPLTIARLKNVTCLARQVLIKDDLILPESFRRRNPKHEHVQLEKLPDDLLRPKVSLADLEVITEPCFYLDGEHVDHFGHFMLEVLSRLWPFEKLDLSRYLIITSAKPESRHAELLAPFGIKPEQIRYFRKPVLCKDLTVASQGYILEHSVSDESLAVWRRISEHYATSGNSEAIYISRSHWKKQRYLNQEEQIEQELERNGFEIVRPETLSIPEQIAKIGAARLIVGTTGSGFYNCIYNTIKGQRIILAPSTFVTINDSLINRQSNSEITYLTGVSLNDKKTAMLDDWNIDPDFVLSKVLAHTS